MSAVSKNFSQSGSYITPTKEEGINVNTKDLGGQIVLYQPSRGVGTIDNCDIVTHTDYQDTVYAYWHNTCQVQNTVTVKKFSEQGNKIDPSKPGIKGTTNEDAVQKLIDSGNRYLMHENYLRLTNLLGGI